MDIFLLLADGDGTMHSIPEPFGVAVTSEEEAKKFVESKFSYRDRYQKVTVFGTIQEAIEHWKRKT